MKDFGYHHGRKVEIDLIDIGGGFKLERAAAEAFKRMLRDAEMSGVIFQVNTAFRTMEFQRQLYERYSAALKAGTPHAKVAAPGWSNHQSGIAVDIATQGEHADSLEWLNAHAHKYGFRRTVPSETWHWEYRP